MRTVPVPGTWGARQKEDWWLPGSPFLREAERNGIALLDPADPYRWSTRLDGFLGENDEWEFSGEVLKWYCHAKAPGEPVIIFGHSNGGNVAAYAFARGLIGSLVTVATPVCKDMLDVYRLALESGGLRRWVHIYTGWKDRWQWRGALGSGWWPWAVPREMPGAENIYEPGDDHRSLLDPALWTKRGWWEFVRETAAQPAGLLREES